MAPQVSVERRPGGIAVLAFHNAPVNALSTILQRQLSEHLKVLNADPQVRAVVLHGASAPGFFSSGADVNEFSGFGSGSSPFTPEVRWCFTEAEAARLPVVAAIDGVCFGGGLELVLCCAARISAPNSSFSLPETNLGIIPGLGGTQRLPRAIGFQEATQMIISRSVIDARRAHSLGLIDQIAPPGSSVVEAAVDYATRTFGQSKFSARFSSTEKPRLITEGAKLPPVEECERIAEKLRATLIKKFSKNGALPQYEASLRAALHGVRHGGAAGLVEEMREFERLVVAPHSQGLVHAFFATRATSKPVTQEEKQLQAKGMPLASPAKIRSVAVIGGGLMGAGIAAALVAVGASVVIKELNEKFAQAAQKRVAKNLGAKGAKALSLLRVTTDYAAIADVDMVIEAVLENPKLKIEIFAMLEKTCRPSCILATNTSTLNIDLIGSGAPKAHAQGRVIGVHFFSPAHKMPLVEVVRSEKTSFKVVRDVFALAKKMRKTAVLVGNCAGFAVNRMYFPQGMMATFLVLELGIDPYHVDAVCEKFGLPMGPFRLVDFVGMEVGAAVSGVFAAAFAERATASNPVFASLLSSGRKGQKSGQGFYRYGENDRFGTPDKAVVEPIIQKARDALPPGHAERVRRTFGAVSDDDIVNMVLLPCVNEGYRILHEGVAKSASDLDIVSIMGMAFPSHMGGLMYWAQKRFGGSVGAGAALQSLFKRSAESCNLLRPSFALDRAALRNLPIGRLAFPALATGKAEDVVVVSAFRTAVGRAGRGGLKDTLPDNLMIPIIERIVQETGIPRKDVDDVVAGTVLQRGDTGVVQLRVAGLLGGLPETVPVKTVNRLCSSGLQAIADAAASIIAGQHRIVIAGGVESMSAASMQNKELKPNPSVQKNKQAVGCYMTMGQTSENVAERFGVSRELQDRMAVVSHARASQAKLAGRQSGEIVPIHTTVRIIDRETKKVTGTKQVVVAEDEGVRFGVTKERLAGLPAVFKKGGSTTPGNSSQLSDGAAFVMLMQRSEAEARGLEALASLRAFAVVGVEPAVMGIGPAAAIPAVLQKAGLTIDDIDLFEINEAFGSQADYCIAKLGLNRDIVNVMGGAIAIGHPLGMTGARLTVSIVHELRRRRSRFGVVSMCIGSGMGAAAVYEVNAPRTPSKM